MKDRTMTSLSFAIAVTTTALAAPRICLAETTYECWSYKDGKPQKMIYQKADSKEHAESQAEKKFKGKLLHSWDYVKCHH